MGAISLGRGGLPWNVDTALGATCGDVIDQEVAAASARNSAERAPAMLAVARRISIVLLRRYLVG